MKNQSIEECRDDVLEVRFNLWRKNLNFLGEKKDVVVIQVC